MTPEEENQEVNIHGVITANMSFNGVIALYPENDFDGWTTHMVI